MRFAVPNRTRRLIDELYRRLQDGEPFDELARRYSDDAASGSQGGDLGLDPEWPDGALSLSR